MIAQEMILRRTRRCTLQGGFETFFDGLEYYRLRTPQCFDFGMFEMRYSHPVLVAIVIFLKFCPD
jgi:hypothetical protein